MADMVTRDPESAVAQRIIPQVLKLRAQSPGKTQVVQTILELADQDIRSNKALDQLVSLATKTTGSNKSAALSRISDHHLESEDILDVIEKVTSGRTPDQAAEAWLKDVCHKSSNPTVTGTAAIALKDVIDRRDKFRGILVGADEDIRDQLGEELVAYLEKAPDPSELELIETTLDRYVSENEELVETAKNELFVIKHLSVGSVALEISGPDVDGVDFKLSDYRGKVVFLDFWGDW